MFGVVCVVNFVMVEMANIIPDRVSIKAVDFNRIVMVRGGLNRMKLERIQPDDIVPIAKRFREFVSFGFSSLVGHNGENDGFLRKQKNIIRNEYTEVSRVASRERAVLVRFDSFVSAISRIRSFE